MGLFAYRYDGLQKKVKETFAISNSYAILLAVWNGLGVVMHENKGAGRHLIALEVGHAGTSEQLSVQPWARNEDEPMDL